MDILMLLIPLSVALVLVIAAAFVWSVRHGQFDDLEGPAWRILADDDAIRGPSTGPSAPHEAVGIGANVEPASAPAARFTGP